MAQMIGAKPFDTVTELNVKCNRNGGELISDPTLQGTLVGCIIYLTITHSDISYLVQMISQFISDPQHLH